MYECYHPYGEYSQLYPTRAPYSGSTLVLTVVLFILLIIVGRSFV